MEKIYITSDIVNHPLNDGLDLVEGNEVFLSSECPSEKPTPPAGENGYFQCVGGRWVWFPVSIEQ